MSDVAGNLAAVRARIDAAAIRAGRDPARIRLLPVTKTHPVAVLEQAYAAGARLFGENRVQEAVEKAEHFADRPDLGWAMVGHLQTNKAKQVAGFADEFHALDSVKVAAALAKGLRERGRTLDVYLQVNSSGEPQKFGQPPEAMAAFAREIARFEELRVRGLMTLAVFSEDQRAVRACFERMVELRNRLDEDLCGRELSMGMSGDFELAIAHGATTVRVGQAVFGTREG